ncbi:MAG: hypothetical protein HY791_09425 [Deltaproteobacteria bacterium]|nr:hypothetical protein [Deltaproteobacteria bacterium]
MIEAPQIGRRVRVISGMLPALMVGGKVPVTPGQVGKIGDAKVSLEAQARATKLNEVLAQLGAPPAEALTFGARKSLDDLLDRHEGKLETLDVKKAAVSVKNALARDFGLSFNPGPAPGESASIKGNVELTQEKKAGGFELIGAPRGEGHPVRQLLEALGIDPGAFGPNVKAALETQKGKDVAHPDNWKQLGRSLAEAKIKDTPLAKIGGVAGKATASIQSAEGVTEKADLGLAKTARTRDQLASANGATNAEAIMFNEAMRDPSAAGKRDEAVNRLSSLLAYSGLSQSEVEELRPTMDKILKNGQLTAKDPAAKTWAIVKNTHFEVTGKKLPDGNKPPKNDPTVAEGLAMSAAYQLQFLAEAKTGKKIPSTGFLDNAATIIGNYAGSTQVETRGSAKDTLGKLNFSATKSVPKADAAKAQKANGPKAKDAMAKELKAEAARYAQGIGIQPDSASTAHTMRDIETAFATVIKPGASDKDISKAALEYINAKTGGAEATFAKHATYVLASAEGDPTTAQMMKEVTLRKLTLLAAAGPEAYKQNLLAQASAGGPSMAQMGAMPGTIAGLPPGMDLGRATDNLQGNYRQMMTASILADPALSVEDKVMLVLMLVSQSMDQDRVRKMQEIADFDRMQSMKDQNGPGAQAARLAREGGATKPGATGATQAQNTQTVSGKQGGAPPTAPSHGAAAQGGPPKPPNNGAAAGAPPPPPPPPPGGRGPAASPIPGPAPQGVQPQTMDLNTARAEGDAPKSREVLMAELDRINKVRDSLFQVMHQLIQKYDESTRGVIRSMQH